MRRLLKHAALAAGLVGSLAMSMPSMGVAAPVTTGAAGLKTTSEALPGGTTEVRWRGRNAGAAIVGGLALGLVGAAAANAYGPRYYYGPGPYYGGPYYGAPYYAYGPRYYGRPHWRHRHWRHR